MKTLRRCHRSTHIFRWGLVVTLRKACSGTAQVRDEAGTPKPRDGPEQDTMRGVEVGRFPIPIASPKLVHPEALCGHDALQGNQQHGDESWCGGVANQKRKEVGQQSNSVQVRKHLSGHTSLGLTSQNTATQRHHDADVEGETTKPQGPEELVEPLEEAVAGGWRGPSAGRGCTGHVGSLEDCLRGVGASESGGGRGESVG